MKCTKGYSCANESLNLSPGFYWRWVSTDARKHYNEFTRDLDIHGREYNESHVSFEYAIPKAYACPVAGACIGGQKSRCARGYEGPLCAVCGNGYFKALVKCQKCPTLPWIIGQIVIVAVVFLLTLVLITRDKRNEGSGGRSLTDIFLARLKIVIGFYQVTTGTFDAFVHVQWPEAVSKSIKYAKMLQLNLLQVAPLHCLVESLKVDSYTDLVVVISFNVAVVMSSILYCYLRKAHITLKASLDASEKKKLTRLSWERCWRFVLVVLFITYPSTCSNIFRILPQACHEICASQEGHLCHQYMKTDYSVQCYDSKYNKFVMFARFLMIYALGFPVVLLFLMWKYREKDSRNKGPAISAGLTFLFENYSEKCWFWEIIELARKVLFTSALILVDSESRTYLGTAALMSGLYSVCFASYKPMKDQFEHWLQLASLLATSVTLSVGILLKVPVNARSSSLNTRGEGIGVTALLIAANIVVLLMVIGTWSQMRNIHLIHISDTIN